MLLAFLFFVGRRINLELHQPIDAKVQIEVRKFKGLRPALCGRMQTSERLAASSPPFAAFLCASRNGRVRGGRLDAAGLCMP